MQKCVHARTVVESDRRGCHWHIRLALKPVADVTRHEHWWNRGRRLRIVGIWSISYPAFYLSSETRFQRNHKPAWASSEVVRNRIAKTLLHCDSPWNHDTPYYYERLVEAADSAVDTRSHAARWPLSSYNLRERQMPRLSAEFEQSRDLGT